MSIVRAKKSLGQHFLVDQNIARKITESLLPITKNVVEIGPGMGVLTKYLFESNDFNIMAIDIDHESIEYLHKTYPDHINQIVYGDFLKNSKDFFPESDFSIIGNLPYNISSQIFFKILERKNEIKQVVCMIQKEVAERLNSPCGNKVYGILSVFLQTYYDIEYLFTVSEKVFNPPPKVKSAVIRLTRNKRDKLSCDEKLFFNIVKYGFNQRRKTLRNSIKAYLPPNFSSEYLSKRPEQLRPEDFILLCNEIETFR